MNTAVFGGGCFWCTEAVFAALRGVHAVEPGYCGGHVDSPTYEQICDGRTGHIEVVRIEFDEALITYETLLDVFFATHDPTTPGRQGHDVGPQYQSAIFAQSAEQMKVAQNKIAQINSEDHFAVPICTLLLDAERFWPAEPYHHNYFENNPGQGYCQVVVAPKVLKLKSKYASLLK